MRVPLWLKIAWTVWVVCWAPIYWKQYGAQNFLFFCDLGNLIIALALWSESALLFSWQAVSLLVFQGLFTIDLASAWLSGHRWIGGTEFMFDPHLPLLVRILSLFHVVTPVVLLWAVWRLAYDARAWKLATIACWILVPINYFWRPEHNVNWARGIFFIQQRVVPAWLYLLAYLVSCLQSSIIRPIWDSSVGHGGALRLSRIGRLLRSPREVEVRGLNSNDQALQVGSKMLLIRG